jgi:hypothetical protein
MQTQGIELRPTSSSLYDLTEVREGQTSASWCARWSLPTQIEFVAWNLPQAGEETLVGSGWGQRDPSNKDVGTTLPYLVRRCTGEGRKCFVSLFEGGRPGELFVRGVRRVELAKGSARGGCAIEVETSAGRDYIVCSPSESLPRLAAQPQLALPKGCLSVVSTGESGVRWSFGAAPGGK